MTDIKKKETLTSARLPRSPMGQRPPGQPPRGEARCPPPSRRTSATTRRERRRRIRRARARRPRTPGPPRRSWARRESHPGWRLFAHPCARQARGGWSACRRCPRRRTSRRIPFCSIGRRRENSTIPIDREPAPPFSTRVTQTLEANAPREPRAPRTGSTVTARHARRVPSRAPSRTTPRVYLLHKTLTRQSIIARTMIQINSPRSRPVREGPFNPELPLPKPPDSPYASPSTPRNTVSSPTASPGPKNRARVTPASPSPSSVPP